MKKIATILLLILAGCGGATLSRFEIPRSSVSLLEDATVALVTVVPGTGTMSAYCTGTFVSETEVLTAAHCIDEEETRVKVSTHGDYVRSEGKYWGHWTYFDVIRADTLDDLALLRLSSGAHVSAHSVLELADEPPVTGERVVIVGHPAGLLAWTFTTGIVSSSQRNGWGNEYPGEYVRAYIQCSAGIYFGNSGGPVLNVDNEIVGVVSQGIPGASHLGMSTHLTPIKTFINQG